MYSTLRNLDVWQMRTLKKNRLSHRDSHTYLSYPMTHGEAGIVVINVVVHGHARHQLDGET